MTRFKKIAGYVIVLLLIFSGVSFAEMYKQKIFDAETITAGANSTKPSTAINLKDYDVSGSFAIQVILTGDGTAKGECLVSLDNSNFYEPSMMSDIFTGHIKTSGSGSDGIDIYDFNPPLHQYIKIKITETGGVNSVVVTVWLIVQ